LATEQALALSINGQDESSNIAFENDDSMEMKFPYKKCSPTENPFSGVNLNIRDLFN